MRSESWCRCDASTGATPLHGDACRSGPAPRERPTRAACTARKGDCDRRGLTQRPAGKSRDPAGQHRTYGMSGKPRQKGVQRLPAGGNPSRPACSCGVTHQLALTLPHQQSTAGIINTLAGWLPLSAKRPVRTEVLTLHESISKPLPRPPEGVGPSKPSVPIRVGSDLRTPRSNATYQHRAQATQTRLPTNPRTVLHNPHPTPESTEHCHGNDLIKNTLASIHLSSGKSETAEARCLPSQKYSALNRSICLIWSMSRRSCLAVATFLTSDFASASVKRNTR